MTRRKGAKRKTTKPPRSAAAAKSAPAEDTTTEKKLDRLDELVNRLIDSLRESVGAGMPAAERSRAVTDFERLVRTLERVQKLSEDAGTGSAPRAAETLLDLIREYEKEKKEGPSTDSDEDEGALPDSL